MGFETLLETRDAGDCRTRGIKIEREAKAVGCAQDAQLATWRDQLAKRASAFEKMYDEKKKNATLTSSTPPRSPHHIAISPINRHTTSFDPVRGPGAIEDGGPKIDVGTPSSPPTSAPIDKLKSLPAPHGLPAALEFSSLRVRL